MAGLILKLRPHEELMVNGVVLENGDRNARLRIKTEGAHILRMREAIKPEEAKTPLTQAYYIAQLAVSGHMRNGEAADVLNAALKRLPADDEREKLQSRLAAHDFYGVMRLLRNMAPAEIPCAKDQALVSKAPRLAGGYR